MYTPEPFQVTDPAALHAFMAQYSFATLVTTGSEPFVTHLPLIIQPQKGDHGTLLGHVARPNPHWQHDHAANASVAIFHGPHAYISPSWYSGKSPAVPTWNYAVVHAHGKLKLIEDPKRTRAILDQLVDIYEADLPTPWVNQLPAPMNEKLIASVVAFEMPIDKLEGKFKLGQNRSKEDQQGAIAGLESRNDPESATLAAFTRTYLSDPNV